MMCCQIFIDQKTAGPYLPNVIHVWPRLHAEWFHDISSTDIWSTTLRLQTFNILQHFSLYGTVIHPTSVSANHYFHQFQLLLTL